MTQKDAGLFYYFVATQDFGKTSHRVNQTRQNDLQQLAANKGARLPILKSWDHIKRISTIFYIFFHYTSYLPRLEFQVRKAYQL